MIGMDRNTGRARADLEHIRQSIGDILGTPIGTRVMRRNYGSLIPALIDRPVTQATLLQVQAAAVDAIDRWEPRVRVQAVALLDNTADTVNALRNGKVDLTLTLQMVDSEATLQLEVTA